MSCDVRGSLRLWQAVPTSLDRPDGLMFLQGGWVAAPRGFLAAWSTNHYFQSVFSVFRIKDAC